MIKLYKNINSKNNWMIRSIFIIKLKEHYRQTLSLLLMLLVHWSSTRRSPLEVVRRYPLLLLQIRWIQRINCLFHPLARVSPSLTKVLKNRLTMRQKQWSWLNWNILLHHSYEDCKVISWINSFKNFLCP